MERKHVVKYAIMFGVFLHSGYKEIRNGHIQMPVIYILVIKVYTHSHTVKNMCTFAAANGKMDSSTRSHAD